MRTVQLQAQKKGLKFEQNEPDEKGKGQDGSELHKDLGMKI